MRLIRVITGRRSKWVVIAAWLVAATAIVALGLPGRFAAAQTNEPATFLPEGVESVQALHAVQRLPGGEQNPALIVVRRAGGLTHPDRTAIRRLVSDVRGASFGGVASVAAPRYSPKGDAAIVVASLPSSGDSNAIVDAVDDLRARADRLAADRDVETAVTGPAGYAADAIDVFSGINGTLLGATALLVLVLLVLIYRSPIFWMIPLAAVGITELSSRGFGYLATEAGLTVNGQTAGILLVLVFGAGTDYALLLVSRYREELRAHEDTHEAAALALRRAAPAIIASAGTVTAALLVLIVARVNSTAALGPIGAMGIVLALLGALTLLPALLAATGRRAFWPFIPQGDGGGDEATSGVWRRFGAHVARAPRRVWAGGAALLVVLCAGSAFLDVGLPQPSQFRGTPESVRGNRLLNRSFPPGVLAPATVVVPPGDSVERVRTVLGDAPGVVSVSSHVRRGPPGTVLEATLDHGPYSAGALSRVQDLRRRLDEAGLDRTLIGGATAVEHDYRAAALRDDELIPPLVLVVVLVILAVVLRAVALPALLIVSVILSYGAALGAAAFVFAQVFGFPGLEPSLVLLAFIFLVGLGVDYNIFLMTRAREEVARHGHREGVLRALAATGTVITSAGIVLAGTFSTLAVLPLAALTEIGFLVAFGVLLDALLVRSLLIPALTLDLGRGVWWPSRLAGTVMSRPVVHWGRIRAPIVAGCFAVAAVSWFSDVLPGWVGFLAWFAGIGVYTRIGHPPERAPVRLRAPVSGRWRAINSPADRVPSHGLHAYGQTYAIDLVYEPADGRRPALSWWPLGRPPESFPGFGREVRAPATGTVVRARDGQRDHWSRNSYLGLLVALVEASVREIGGPGRILGNHVVLKLADGTYAAVAHLQRGSVTVTAGEHVAPGDALGRCGNSGSSTEPHVHLQCMDHRRFLLADGVPFAFEGAGVPTTRRPFVAPAADRTA